MSHASLALFAQDYNLPQSARVRLSTIMSQILSSSMRRLHKVLTESCTEGGQEDHTVINAIAQTVSEMTLSDTTIAMHGLSDDETVAAPFQEKTDRFASVFVNNETLAAAAVPSPMNDALDESPGFVESSEGQPSPEREAWGRYEDLGLLGVGGMGEVRRVHERDLNRTLAMKIIKPELLSQSKSLARFLEEAQVSAQLQHPNIIPVHELGRLPDGRYYFTMREVHGRELSEVIAEVHAGSEDGHCQVDHSGDGLRMLISILLKASQAIGHAHTRGVVHRDLKPSNIMVGRDSEVFVVDWGIVKVAAREEHGQTESDVALISSDRSSTAELRTLFGTIAGTPAYMPPEQAQGLLDQIDARADVYALGATLYHILTGRPPYQGPHANAVLMQLMMSEVEAPSQVSSLKVPEELETICLRALSKKREDRFANGRELSKALQGWLDGSKRRERALAIVEQARASLRCAAVLREEAERKKVEGASLLEEVPVWSPEAAKHAGWDLEDEAEEKEHEAQREEIEARQLLHTALNHAPGLVEAHMQLAVIHQRAHRNAETARDNTVVLESEAQLRAHVNALHKNSEASKGFSSYLQGTGALTLLTNPPGAEVHLYRYVKHQRRLVPKLLRSLGHTPLQGHAIKKGNYIIELKLKGHKKVRYPVMINRGEHWHGVRPGDHEPSAIVLPPHGGLDADDRYIPAGWFWAAGDPDNLDSCPRRRHWADAFIMKQFPVTNRQYIAFLDDLVTQGREDEAMQHVPRERGGTAGALGAMIYHYNEKRFSLQADADGDAWLADYPVLMIDWHGARAYGEWLARRDNKPWRLPAEFEWEKAARGVDGRIYPWGDFLDPSWCRMRHSASRSRPAVVESYKIDRSPFGVRGMGGNVRDWCADVFVNEALDEALVDASGRLPLDAKENPHRAMRGGAWNYDAHGCRSLQRNGSAPSYRSSTFGFRLARSL